MTSVAPLRIDTAIQPASHLRMRLYVGLISVMLLLAWFAALALWQYVLILIVAAAVTLYLTVSRPIVLHVSQPPLSQRVERQWQLLVRTGRGDELWQAQLIAVHGYQWAMSFEFVIVEPYRRDLSVTVFRDQVNADEWRVLSILANVHGS